MSANTERELDTATTWRVFRREIDGKAEEFTIETLLEDEIETALEYLCEYFPKDEPIANALGIYEDEECVTQIREFWRAILQEKMSFVCHKKLGNGEKEFVAISICCIKPKNSNSLLKEGMHEKKKKMFAVFKYLFDFKDLFEEFGVDKYLVGAGLFTMPKYRGYNIGMELLLARKPLCDSLGVKLAATIFTGPASQRLAEKAGYKDLVSLTYEEIGRKNPYLQIPNIKAERIRYMYIKY